VLHASRLFDDADGDGYSPDHPEDPDADDADLTIHPGAPELCDGKDNDQDTSIDEDFVCDSDRDGLDDAEDPDEVMDVVLTVPKSAFGSGGQPKAFKTNLDKAEQLLLAGDEAGALTELRSLRLRVDGCNGSAREKADKNDWITVCSHQRAVRTAIDSLVATLQSA
jgi:hypothetical protein